MKTKITTLVLVTASFLFAETMASAQTCGTSQVTYSGYTSGYLPKWNATTGCVNNSSIFDNGEIGIGLTAPASRFHSAGQIRSGIPSGGLGGASATTGALLFYNSSNTNTVNIQSGVTTTSYSMTLPPTQGSASSVLMNNGSGGLDWAQLNVGFWGLTGNTLTGTLPASPAEFIGTINAADWVIQTNSTERMRIQSGGNVGIGITVPATLLHTKSAASTDNEIRIDVTSGANKSIVGLANAGTDYGQLYFDNSTNNVALYQKYTSGDLLLGTNSVTNVIVKNGGNVGIGIVSPVCKLHILDVIGNVASNTAVTGTGNVSIQSSYAGRTAGTGAALTFALPANTDGTNIYEQARILGAADNSTNVNASGRMYLQTRYYTGSAWDWKSNLVLVSNGNVGIGTTAPGYKLDVSGDARVTTRMGIGVAPNASYDLYIQNSAFSVTGTWGGSDIRLKKDTSSFTDGLNIIKQIHPINYRYNGKAGVTDTNQFFVSVVAQQLQTVMPNAIKPYFARFNTPNDTTEAPIELLSINTQPLLFASINAIKELAIKDSIKDTKIKTIETSDSISTALNNIQQQSIDSLSNIVTSLQNQLNQLASLINDCCNNNGNGHGNNLMPSGNSGQNNRSMNANDVTPQGETTLTDIELSNKNIIVLNQNVPNPFAEQTTISYYLPENTVKAQMLFYNAQGKLIQSAELVQKGKGQLNVFANDLTNGIYTYTLVVDDKIIETKKMLKQ